MPEPDRIEYDGVDKLEIQNSNPEDVISLLKDAGESLGYKSRLVGKVKTKRFYLDSEHPGDYAEIQWLLGHLIEFSRMANNP